MHVSKIHPTAIVDSSAQLAIDVEVGPYCVIGPDVRIGARSVIQSHAVLEGEVTMGEGNVVGHGTIIGGYPQDLSFTPERKTGVVIGNNNVFREHGTVHRGTAEGSMTRIGDGNFFMTGTHVGHNCQIGNGIIIANNCLLGGYVEVADQVFLGGACVFHQHMRVGRLAITQGASAFSMDIPPFLLAAERNQVFGLNVIGLRRSGFSAKDREEIKAVFKLVYRSGLNIAQTLEKAGGMSFGPLAREFLDFVSQAKKRGICPLRGKGGEVEL